MIAELLRDVKADLRELPGVAIAIVVAIAVIGALYGVITAVPALLGK